jgi:bifunctional DNase/RNase
MADARVEVSVENVFADPNGTGNYFIGLRDEASRWLPIYISPVEALAISATIQGLIPSRPLTHDAMLTCLGIAGAAMTEAYINGLREDTFYALITLRVGDQAHQIDVRPSDAVALAVRAQCPIFVSEDVIRAIEKRNASVA